MKRIFLLCATVLLMAACTESNPVLTIEDGQIQGVPTATPDVIVY